MFKKFILVFLLVGLVMVIQGCQSPQIEITFGMSDDKNNVRQNLKLQETFDGETIAWTSSNTEVISDKGIVFRPSQGEQDQLVTLKAKTSKVEKTFKLRVKSLTDNQFYNEYPSVNDANHVFREINYDALMNLFNSNENHIVLLGWPTCTWCIEYVYYYNKLAKQEGIAEILYFNHRTIRNDIEVIDNKVILSDEFKALTDKIDAHLIWTHPSDQDAKWIYSPTLLVFKSGQVTKTFGGAIEGHVASTSRLSEAQKVLLILGVTELYQEYKN
jgi:hypothetical protein